MADRLIYPNIGSKITSLYFAEDWIDSWYDHTNKVIVTTWFNLSTNIHYRKSYLAKLEAAKNYRPRALIIDTSRAFGVPYPEDQRWLITTVFPEAKKLDLECIINIFPKNSIAKTGVKTMLDFGKKFNLPIIEKASLEDALDFLKSNQQNSSLHGSPFLSCASTNS
ncbi:MAG: hypothetical protein V4635_02310 [Bacteroidota bacterium]